MSDIKNHDVLDVLDVRDVRDVRDVDLFTKCIWSND